MHMAEEAKKSRYCRFQLIENGKEGLVRRIHHMAVQASDGRVYYLQGSELPPEIICYTGVPYGGVHSAVVLLSPRSAKGVALPDHRSWPCTRDLIHMGIGGFCFALTSLLAFATYFSLT